MGRESFPGLEGQPPRSLLETHGDVLVTYRGDTLPLRAWLGFCQSKKPIEEWDPVKVNEVAQALLDGQDPFSQESE